MDIMLHPQLAPQPKPKTNTPQGPNPNGAEAWPDQAVTALPALFASGVLLLSQPPAGRAGVVLIEFESIESAKAAYQSPAYQAAHKLLDDGADRDIRIVEAA